MIRAEVNVVVTLKRGAIMRTDKKNNPYLSFLLAVKIPNGMGGGKDMEMFVTINNARKNDVSTYVENRRVLVQGSLDIRKRGDDYAFYLSAAKLSVKDVPDTDAITGEMQFSGRLKKDNVYEEKRDRNGHPYLAFSAYSSEKVGDGFASTWVRFIRFSTKDETLDDIKPDWIRPKARVCIHGDLQVSIYENVFRFTCIVKRMEEYVKPI